MHNIYSLRIFVIFAMAALTFAGCDPTQKDKSELKVFEVKSSDFDHIINDKPLPVDPNINQDKTILNRDYPIEIALYNDGKWYSDLPNLDTGTGTWEYKEGKIELHAERDLFDMKIDIVATEEGGEKMAVKFSDRFGPKVLNVEKVNQ
jgi:hypothetical protein